MRSRLAACLGIAAALTSAAHAQSYRMTGSVISSGGGEISGGAFKMNGTIGQPVAGFVQGTNILHWIGFWSGDDPAPTVVATASAAKLLADGTFVSVAGKIAASATGDFPGFFYIQEPNRSSGIRVAAPPLPALVRGSVVNVIGALGTTAEGERMISGPAVIITGSDTPVTPLGMPNKALGGSSAGYPPLGQYGVAGGTGLNNVGLLVQTWGKVVSTGAGFVMVDDGSGPVRVDTSYLASPPDQDDYITVIGISSLYKPGSERQRLILPRGATDVP